jgi:UDP-N-acetylmuramoylalanine--D-glutamate ligase
MAGSYYLVAGLGKTGHSIARYLQRRNKPFAVFDTRPEPEGLGDFYAEFPGVDVHLKTLPESLYKQLTEIISSPGVSLDDDVMRKAIELGIPVIGDIECLAREIHAPVVAITGTNGKSTVTTLVGEMARKAGLTVAVAGNIGTPVLDLLDNDVAYDLWVLELSSFQLDLTYSLAPVAATILNVSPDHLDRHHSLEAYVQAKQRVYCHANMMIYNRSDEQTKPTSIIAETISYGLNEPTSKDWGIITTDSVPYLCQGSDKLMPMDSLYIKGLHNWENALAACALAEAVCVARCDMVCVLEQFKGLPHRTQWVRTMDGVDFINDSKGTNIGATISAISGIGGSVRGKIVLIAGGQGKGADFTELRAPVGEYVRSLVLIGEDADKLEKALSDVVDITRAASLDEAVDMAAIKAKPGDVVLLSPACASLDMFHDFNHRGQVFTQVVNAR